MRQSIGGVRRGEDEAEEGMTAASVVWWGRARAMAKGAWGKEKGRV